MRAKPTLITTLWSFWSLRRLSDSEGKLSTCCWMAAAMAGTKLRGFRSRSSQRTSANCSAVSRFSFLFHMKVSRSF